MKINNQKGFIIPLVIAIVVILAIGGVFFYKNKKVDAPAVTGTSTSPVIVNNVDKTVTINGIAITPLEVTSDSRCAKEVVCVWAGTVTLKVELKGLTSTQTVLTLGKPFVFQGYNITLEKVNPVKTLKPILPAEYTFEFSVIKIPVASCTPNWTCGWAPCSNGYQGMTAVDSNNCGVSSSNVQIACPALARACDPGCNCPTDYIQEGNTCNPKCYYSTPKCLIASVMCTSNKIISTTTNPVACTMDAMMCPDGTYVGRSGPDCKFVCPNSANSDFYSPQKGTVFNFGDTITIRWNPKAIDASTIVLRCNDSTLCPGSNYQIYRRQDINDRASIDGLFSYLIPSNYLGPMPGRYKLIIYSYDEKTSIKSEEFIIAAPPETAPRVLLSQYFQNVSGYKDNYKPGEAITVTIDARDYTGVPASPDRGFNIQAHIFDANNYPGPSYQAVNASYDQLTNLWKVEMNAPTDKSVIYNLQFSLYCSYLELSASNNSSSVCVQEHGTGPDNQLDKTISFVVR